MKEYVIGMDIGTTNVKTVLFQTDGTVEKVEEQKIKTIYPEKQYAEQNPQEIEAAARKTLRNILQHYEQNKILGIGLSTAMHSLLLADSKGDPLTNAMIWSDARGSHAIQQLTNTEKKNIYLKTGTPVHAMTPFAKLLWMNQESYLAKDHSFVFSLKEYILFQWFGERVIDYSMANATGLFNIHSLEWDEEILKYIGIRLNQLSCIVSPDYRLKNWHSHIKKDLVLKKEIPFIIGAADGQLANLGSGAIDSGEVAVTMGTSGAIRQFTEGFPIDQAQQIFTYAFTKNKSIIGGPTNNGGVVIQWLKDLMKNEQDFSSFINQAKESRIGANGLLFIPYINGERAPLWDPQATGQFKNIQIKHNQADFVRAVLEGITYNLMYIANFLENTGYTFQKINVNGGLAQSSIWSQMLADMFGKTVFVSETHHNAAWGAAFIALYSIEKVTNIQEIKQTLPKEVAYYSDIKNHEIYQRNFIMFKENIKSDIEGVCNG